MVVPIYNVEDYLVSCLESLAEQTFGNLEVILVDDGSPDSSGAMAEDFARGREGWSVLHVPNGGLGRARNIGLDHATADYVTFVDSDDLVPRDAYELMMHAIEASGSDIVSGGVLRFDGARTRPSGLHRRAVPETRVRTHIRELPTLLYDTTAWNKIFRREFLLEHGLRFPEGVYYEDIPLTVPAHYLARSVDLVSQPVYLWRERQTAEQSITQRRAEVRNLVDRMAAVSSVNEFLERTHEVEGKQLHDLKVLTLDMPLFLDVLHEGDAEFAETLVRIFAEYLSDVDPAVVASLPPRRRLAYHLISHGQTAELVEAHQRQLRVPKPKVVRHGLRPLRRPAVLRRREGRRPRRGLRGDALAAARHRHPRRPLGERRAGGRRPRLHRRGPRRGAGHDGAPAAAAARGLQGSTPHREGPPGPAAGPHRAVEGPERDLRRRRHPRADPRGRPRPPGGQGLGRVRAHRPGRSARGPPRLDRRHPRVLPRPAPAPRVDAGGGVRRPGIPGTKLRLAVRRPLAVVHDVRVHDEVVTIVLHAAPGREIPDSWLHLRRLDASTGATVRVEHVGGEVVARFPAAALEVTSRSLAERAWRLWLVEAKPEDAAEAPAAASSEPAADAGTEPSEGSADASRDPLLVPAVDALVSRASGAEGEKPRSTRFDGRHVAPLDLGADPAAGRARLHGRLLQLRQSGVTGAFLIDGPCRPELTHFSFGPDGLELLGDTGGAAWTASSSCSPADRLEVPSGLRRTRWRAFVPATGVPGSASLRWLRPGRWTVVAGAPGETDPELACTSRRGPRRTSGQLGGEPVGVTLRTSPSTTSSACSPTAAGPGRTVAPSTRRSRARSHYRVARRLPLTDTVFFEAWKGRQYSDNPRADLRGARAARRRPASRLGRRAPRGRGA